MGQGWPGAHTKPRSLQCDLGLDTRANRTHVCTPEHTWAHLSLPGPVRVGGGQGGLPRASEMREPVGHSGLDCPTGCRRPPSSGRALNVGRREAAGHSPRSPRRRPEQLGAQGSKVVWAPGLPGHVRARGRGGGGACSRGKRDAGARGRGRAVLGGGAQRGGAWARGKWGAGAGPERARGGTQAGRGLAGGTRGAGGGGAERGHRLPALSAAGSEHAQCGAGLTPLCAASQREITTKSGPDACRCPEERVVGQFTVNA